MAEHGIRSHAAAPAARSTLAAAAEWWLGAGCSCGRTRLLPCRLLARELAPDWTIRAAVARLRCGECRAGSDRAEMVDNPKAGAQGYVSGAPARQAKLVGQRVGSLHVPYNHPGRRRRARGSG